MARLSIATVLASLALATVVHAQGTTPPDSCLMQAMTSIPAWAPMTVVRHDGVRLKGYLDHIDLRTGIVSVRIGSRFGGDLTEVPRDQVARFERRLSGGNTCTVAGAVLGGLLGAAGGAAIAKSESDGGLDDIESNVSRGFGYGVVGACIGALVGGLLGHLADNASGGKLQVIQCLDTGR